jgi:hypothetical protein
MPVASHIHLSKAAHITHAHHGHGEVAEKINNILRLVPRTMKKSY